MLEVVDLEGFEKEKFLRCPADSKERVAIARAIVNEPEILFVR